MNFKQSLAQVAVVLAAAVAPTAQADTVWHWTIQTALGTNEGDFITDGSGGGAGWYNLIDFSVTTAGIADTITGTYSAGDFYIKDQYLPLAMYFDGGAVTQWQNSLGNGNDSDFFWYFSTVGVSAVYFFGFGSDGTYDPALSAIYMDGQFLSGLYNVSFSGSSAVPEPASAALALLGLAALSATRRKR